MRKILSEILRRKTRSAGAVLAIGILAVAPACAAPPFPNGLPTSPGFFPISVWLQNPVNAPEFKAIGINVFVGLWDGPTEAQLATLAKYNMWVIAQQNDVALASKNNTVVKGWLQPDEQDNAQPDGKGGYGPCVPATTVAERSRQSKLHDPSRPIFINFGQGIAYQGWVGRGVCTGDMAYYDTAVTFADILDFDIYPVANAAVPTVQDKLQYVGFGVDQLVKRAGRGQRVWAAIETSKIGSNHIVTPAQLNSEVWMALIHGATGLLYFVHEWTDGFREDGIFRHPEIVKAVTEVNTTIKALAPVLNSPNAQIGLSVSSPVISTMIKKKGKILYVFTVSMKSTTLQASFTLPKVTATTAIVAGENRSVPIVNGKFVDTFGGYAVHRYEINAG